MGKGRRKSDKKPPSSAPPKPAPSQKLDHDSKSATSTPSHKSDFQLKSNMAFKIDEPKDYRASPSYLAQQRAEKRRENQEMNRRRFATSAPTNFDDIYNKIASKNEAAEKKNEAKNKATEKKHEAKKGGKLNASPVSHNAQDSSKADIKHTPKHNSASNAKTDTDAARSGSKKKKKKTGKPTDDNDGGKPVKEGSPKPVASRKLPDKEPAVPQAKEKEQIKALKEKRASTILAAPGTQQSKKAKQSQVKPSNSLLEDPLTSPKTHSKASKADVAEGATAEKESSSNSDSESSAGHDEVPIASPRVLVRASPASSSASSSASDAPKQDGEKAEGESPKLLAESTKKEKKSKDVKKPKESKIALQNPHPDHAKDDNTEKQLAAGISTEVKSKSPRHPKESKQTKSEDSLPVEMDVDQDLPQTSSAKKHKRKKKKKAKLSEAVVHEASDVEAADRVHAASDHETNDSTKKTDDLAANKQGSDGSASGSASAGDDNDQADSKKKKKDKRKKIKHSGRKDRDATVVPEGESSAGSDEEMEDVPSCAQSAAEDSSDSSDAASGKEATPQPSESENDAAADTEESGSDSSDEEDTDDQQTTPAATNILKRKRSDSENAPSSVTSRNPVPHISEFPSVQAAMRPTIKKQRTTSEKTEKKEKVVDTPKYPPALMTAARALESILPDYTGKGSESPNDTARLTALLTESRNNMLRLSLQRVASNGGPSVDLQGKMAEIAKKRGEELEACEGQLGDLQGQMMAMLEDAEGGKVMKKGGKGR